MFLTRVQSIQLTTILRIKNAFNIEMHSTNFKHISSLLKKHSREYALLALLSS